MRLEDGHAPVEVRDDGAGGADTSGGSGLRGLADRVSALSGSLEIDGPPGEGTALTATIALLPHNGPDAEAARSGTPVPTSR